MLQKIDLSRADLNLLVLFEVVLEERHVGRAAERLSLSSSAVSHGLGRLRRLLNDPLFLKTPKGVVPTARAEQLAAPVADVLARARSVISTAEPFDPATCTRRFTIGAPDGVSAVFLPPLLARASTIERSTKRISSSRCAQDIRSQPLPPWSAFARCSIWWSRSAAIPMDSSMSYWRSRTGRGGSRSPSRTSCSRSPSLPRQT